MVNTVFNIQVMRAVAALLVVFYHLKPVLNANFGTAWTTEVGAFGVDVFFVISGFIMFYTNRRFARRPMDFFVNQILRIVPLYWLATFVLVAIFLAGFQPNGLHDLSPSNFFKSLIFIKSEFPDGRRDLVLSLGWTLFYELYFYAIFAATLNLRSLKASLAILVFIFSTSIIAKSLFGPLPALVDDYCSTITMEFAFGGALALFYMRLSPLASKWHPPVAAGLIIVGAGLAVLASDMTDIPQGHDGLRFIFFGLPAVLVVGGALIFERAGWTIQNKYVLLLGAASYSLYLFHPIMIQASAKMIHRVSSSPYWASLGAVLVTLIGAVLIHLLIERRVTLIGRSQRPVPAPI